MAKKTKEAITLSFTLKELEALTKFYTLGSYIRYGGGEIGLPTELLLVNKIYERLIKQLLTHKSKFIQPDQETNQLMLSDKAMFDHMKAVSKFMQWQLAAFIKTEEDPAEKVKEYFAQGEGLRVPTLNVVKHKNQKD